MAVPQATSCSAVPGDDMRGRQLTLLDPFERHALLTGGGNDSVDGSGLAPEIVDLVVD